MAVPGNSTLVILALLPLIAWRLYARVKRMVGRQRLSLARPCLTLLLFPLILLLLAGTALVPPSPQPQKLWWLAAGLVLGALLSGYGLKRTRFEATAQGLFYTPDAWLGIALSALFIARFVWRMGELLLKGAVAPQDPAFALSPYTLGPIGMFAGYYIAYAIGLLVRRSQLVRGEKLTESQPAP